MLTKRPGSGQMHLQIVLKIIREHGPISPEGIAKVAGIKSASVRASIRCARGRELVYVAGHERYSSTQGPWASLYALGKKKDVKPPVNDRNEYQRQYYEHRRAAKLIKARARYQAKTGKAPINLFAQALQIFQIGISKYPSKFN